MLTKYLLIGLVFCVSVLAQTVYLQSNHVDALRDSVRLEEVSISEQQSAKHLAGIATTPYQWKLSQFGESQISVSIQDKEGSKGISLEVEADPATILVMRTDFTVVKGVWTQRIDDGKTEPNWLPLGTYPSVRLTGSSFYRVLIYSDDSLANLVIKKLEISNAGPSDDDYHMAWPMSGPIYEADATRKKLDWLRLFGTGDKSSDLDKAKTAANFVHQRSIVVGLNDPRFAFFGSVNSWEQLSAMIAGDCGNFANALIQACENIGVRSRLVSLGSKRFAEGNEIGETHALVEVFDPAANSWILLDPTFNIMFESESGSWIGIADLMALSNSGATWKPVPIGPVKEGRRVQDYYLPYQSFLFVANAPAVPSLGDRGAAYQSQNSIISEIVKQKYQRKP